MCNLSQMYWANKYHSDTAFILLFDLFLSQMQQHLFLDNIWHHWLMYDKPMFVFNISFSGTFSTHKCEVNWGWLSSVQFFLHINYILIIIVYTGKAQRPIWRFVFDKKIPVWALLANSLSLAQEITQPLFLSDLLFMLENWTLTSTPQLPSSTTESL